MDEFDLARLISVEVVYVDDDMIELATFVGTGHWRGCATAYTVSDDVARFAQEIVQFVDGGPETAFEAGADTGIGLIALRFYRIDKSGHIAGHSRLVSGHMPTNHRPEQVSRLAVEFGVEAWALVKFASQLAELARNQSGRASLVIQPEY